MKIISSLELEFFNNGDKNMNMFFLTTLPENIFLSKKGKTEEIESDRIADLGFLCRQSLLQAMG